MVHLFGSNRLPCAINAIDHHFYLCFEIMLINVNFCTDQFTDNSHNVSLGGACRLLIAGDGNQGLILTVLVWELNVHLKYTVKCPKSAIAVRLFFCLIDRSLMTRLTKIDIPVLVTRPNLFKTAGPKDFIHAHIQ